MVFQEHAQSLLGGKRIEYLFCGTSEKWSPKILTPTTFGDITKCHQGISHLSRQIKQRLVSVARLTAAIQTSQTPFSHLCLAIRVLMSSQEVSATSGRGPRSCTDVLEREDTWQRLLHTQGDTAPLAGDTVPILHSTICFSFSARFQISHFQTPQ